MEGTEELEDIGRKDDMEAKIGGEEIGVEDMEHDAGVEDAMDGKS